MINLAIADTDEEAKMLKAQVKALLNALVEDGTDSEPAARVKGQVDHMGARLEEVGKLA